jgi:hypothetical protein
LQHAKRPHREREHLVRERLRIENRIEALLFTQGIRERPSLRSWERDLAALRTGDGHEMPCQLQAELNRLRRRLVLTLELIREVEAERDVAAEIEPREQTNRKIADLCCIRGIGSNFAAVLTREVFYRSFDNRRQLASYVGIAPMPFQSGTIDRDRRIGRAGNPRARTTMIQLAWLWLRYQPGSDLAQWFRKRVGTLAGRTRRIAIVAMARKLLIALWRYVEAGVVPAGVEIGTLPTVAAATPVAERGDMTRFANPHPPAHGVSRPGSLRTFQRQHAASGWHHQGWEWCGAADAGSRLPGATGSWPGSAASSCCDRRAWPNRSATSAQERLCRRYRKLARMGKLPTVVTAAIARELAGFVWAIAKQAHPVGA